MNVDGRVQHVALVERSGRVAKETKAECDVIAIVLSSGGGRPNARFERTTDVLNGLIVFREVEAKA